MLLRKLNLLLLIPAFIIISCSENSTSPDDNTPKPPTLAERYFLSDSLDTAAYNYYPLDETNQRTGELYEYNYNVSNITMTEKDAMHLHAVSPIDSAVSNDYYAVGEDKIYIHSNSVKEFFKYIDDKFTLNTPVPFEDKWLLLADLDTNSEKSWTPFEYEVTGEANGYDIAGDAKMTVNKMDSTVQYVNGISTTVQQFNVEYEVDVLWQSGNTFYPIFYKLELQYYFARDIGLYMIKQKSTVIDQGGNYYELPGYEKVLK